MKIILFNCGLTVLVDTVDQDLIWNYSWRLDSSGHLRTNSNDYLHLWIAERMSLVGETIDHKDRDKLNNQRENLRPATQGEQIHNRGLQKNNTTGYIGVKKRGNRFIATVNGVGYGSFVTAKEAAKQRDIIVKRLYGDFAVLNFLD